MIGGAPAATTATTMATFARLEIGRGSNANPKPMNTSITSIP